MLPSLSPGTVLLERSAPNQQALLFRNPVEIVTAFSGNEIDRALSEMEALRRRGLHLAGFFSYEAGYHLNGLELLLSQPLQTPLLWFGAYENAEVADLDAPQGDAGRWMHGRAASWLSLSKPTSDQARMHGRAASGASDQAFSFGNFLPDETREAYTEKIKLIQKEIEAGETYQVNYSTRLRSSFTGDPLSAFLALRKKQRASHGALVHTGTSVLLSLSPELFFEIDKGVIRSRPMKGTLSRGRTTREDAARIELLRNDPKSRSENLMIVDLIRNDLARVCRPGTVEVTELFTVEKYETLFQMTSEIQGQLIPETPLTALMQSLFPCGSVTGAPKIRTMQIIRDLEGSERGAYCGSIGYFSPRGEAHFNVAIRTLEVNAGHAVLGVGGGILHDSDPDAEYDECLLKARFLTHPVPEKDFEILETFLWKDDIFENLDEHLARMADSAVYFDFPFDRKKVDRALKEKIEAIRETPSGKSTLRIRLLLSCNGDFSVETLVWMPSAKNPGVPEKIGLASECVDSNNVFLFHKTTRRAFYERHRERAASAGLADLVFLNERGEVTEGTIHNLFLKKDGVLWTPALTCGLLPGIFRARLLRNEEVREKIILPEDLFSADELFIANSVRGLQKVLLDSGAIS